MSALLDGANVSWDQFKTTFRGHHIPLGFMRMKATEFMKLTQGTKTLTEYMHAFNNLLRYAPEFVNTEEKKFESFKRRLGTKLIKTMENSRCEPTMSLSVMLLPRKIRTICMLQLRAIIEP